MTDTKAARNIERRVRLDHIATLLGDAGRLAAELDESRYRDTLMRRIEAAKDYCFWLQGPVG